jgi:hypothetical protein
VQQPIGEFSTSADSESWNSNSAEFSKATKVVGTRRFSVNAYDFNAYDKDSE